MNRSSSARNRNPSSSCTSRIAASIDVSPAERCPAADTSHTAGLFSFLGERRCNRIRPSVATIHTCAARCQWPRRWISDFDLRTPVGSPSGVRTSMSSVSLLVTIFLLQKLPLVLFPRFGHFFYFAFSRTARTKRRLAVGHHLDGAGLQKIFFRPGAADLQQIARFQGADSNASFRSVRRLGVDAYVILARKIEREILRLRLAHAEAADNRPMRS